MSQISWLDFSDEDQRRVREMIQMFSESDTVDDLGIGTLRDAISNVLFPGTSVIQTRARYFLFIPWIYRDVEKRFPNRLVEKGRALELNLIEALRLGGDLDGLIGQEAGQNLRTLPSAVYWSGLSRYQIFNAPTLSVRQYGRQVGRGLTPADLENELAETAAGFWNSEIPDPPDGFFKFEPIDFDLTFDEAQWLSERILTSRGPAEGLSLLDAFIIDLGIGDEPIISSSLRDQRLPSQTSPAIKDLVRHANLFSSAVQGAALLYNLMLAERRPADLEEVDATSASLYKDALSAWADDATGLGLQPWAAQIDEFWACFADNDMRAPAGARRFVSEWAKLIADGGPGAIHGHATRECVRQREFEHKRGQARLANERRLRAWRGESGVRPLSYRWELVQRMLRDIGAGLSGPQGG